MSDVAGSSKRPLGHRGRKGDPLYAIQKLLRAGAEKLTDKQWRRFENSIAAHDAHLAVYAAWSCAQQLRSTYRHPDPTAGRRIAEKVLATFASCPVTDIARLGRTLKRWSTAFLAYFDTGRSNKGGTEAKNGHIELHRRVARGFRNRDNYRLRMLLIGNGPASPTSSKKSPFPGSADGAAEDDSTGASRDIGRKARRSAGDHF